MIFDWEGEDLGVDDAVKMGKLLGFWLLVRGIVAKL
jgi:hypothetical protein